MVRRRDSLPTRWERPAHTKAKHDILVKYLGAWFGILGSTPRVTKAGILDGFAGPGVYSNGEPGSPVLALKTLLDHTQFHKLSGTEFVFVFNEQDSERHASLEQVLAALKDERTPFPPNVSVHTQNQQFSEYAEALLSGISPGQGLIPLFAFIDPFGYSDTSMDLISRLLAYDKAELFIYFDFNSIRRFATSGMVDDSLTALFGCDDYKSAPPAGDPHRAQFLHDLYERQLRACCNMAYVKSFAMYNERGLLINYLFFCTRNLQAFDRMKAAMWNLDPSGEYRFEDRLAGQSVLFGSPDVTGPLQDELAAHFSGRTVSIDEVVRYVMAETPYYSGQVKVKTLRPMQAAGRISSPNQRQAGFFPDGTLITFL